MDGVCFLYQFSHQGTKSQRTELNRQWSKTVILNHVQGDNPDTFITNLRNPGLIKEWELRNQDSFSVDTQRLLLYTFFRQKRVAIKRLTDKVSPFKKLRACEIISYFYAVYDVDMLQFQKQL